MMEYTTTVEVGPRQGVNLKLPFPPGTLIEIDISRPPASSRRTKGYVNYYLDPFGPAVPPEDWSVYRDDPEDFVTS